MQYIYLNILNIIIVYRGDRIRIEAEKTKFSKNII